MTEDIEGLVTSISINQVLVAVLEEYCKLSTKQQKKKDFGMGNIPTTRSVISSPLYIQKLLKY